MNAMKTLRRTSARPASQVRAPWSLAWLGALLGLGLALLVWAPASWLAWGVAKASQGQVQWLNPRGTVWQGSAQLLLSGGPGSRQPQALPGRLHWTLSPAWAGLRLGWRADCCMTQAASVQAAVGWNTLHLKASDHQSSWPAALLSGLGAPCRPKASCNCAPRLCNCTGRKAGCKCKACWSWTLKACPRA